MMFLKPTTSYIVEGQSIKIPKGCSELHHEVELGGKQGWVKMMGYIEREKLIN